MYSSTGRPEHVKGLTEVTTSLASAGRGGGTSQEGVV